MRLNFDKINEKCHRNGISQAWLAEKISVSRECISKWLNAESFPRPKHLLMLGRLLELTYDELVMEDQPKVVVAFRHKTGHCHLLSDEKTAMQIGQMLQGLVPFVAKRTPEEPLRLKNPQCSVEYVEEVCLLLRERYGVSEDLPVPLNCLIKQAFQQDAILVPVLWGQEKDSDNGLSIYLSEDSLTWIILNLDARQCDFKYWLSHELAHVYVIGSKVNTEAFAELFAQHLLFPDHLAEKLYAKVKDVAAVEDYHNRIQQFAVQLDLSARMVYRSLQDWMNRHGLPKCQGDDGSLEVLRQFDDLSSTIFQTLFGKTTNKVCFPDYVKKTSEILGDTFWYTLKKAREKNKVTAGCIQQILKNSCIDAKEIWTSLNCI